MLSSTMQGERSTLAEMTGSPGYFSHVIEVVDKIRAARDASQAVELLEQVTERMGAEVSIFVSFIPEDRTRGSYRLLVACDPQFLSEYGSLARYEDDPWLAHARHHSLAVRGSELELSNQAQRTVFELAQRHGFRSSVIVPAQSRTGLTRTGVLCLGSSVPSYFEADGYRAFRMLAHSVATEFHEWWLSRMRDDLVAGAQINDDDRQLLSLEAEGKSSKEIARCLSVSIACVDSRIRRIRERLHAPTREAAARIALEYGLIRLDTSHGREP